MIHLTVGDKTSFILSLCDLIAIVITQDTILRNGMQQMKIVNI
jgi:hypothetical protein